MAPLLTLEIDLVKTETQLLNQLLQFGVTHDLGLQLVVDELFVRDHA